MVEMLYHILRLTLHLQDIVRRGDSNPEPVQFLSVHGYGQGILSLLHMADHKVAVLPDRYFCPSINEGQTQSFQRVLAAPNLHPQIKQYVQAKLDVVNKAKAGGAQPAAAAPATTVAPAQVEVKKP